jgi:hypothetical protein
MLWIVKGRMWYSPNTGLDSIKTFDEHYLVGLLLIFEVPFVSWIGLNRPSFSLVVRIDDFGRDKIRLRDRVSICHSKRVSIDGSNRTPGLDRISIIISRAMNM